jgi:predicted flavoprotein YhiN
MSGHFDAVVVGGGAAGLMCALTAGRRGKRVLVVEHANRVGKKILMSGGGRCNFTNTGATPANYLSAIRTSASRRWRVTRRGISSTWSNATASRTTRKSWDNSSAMSRRS